MKTHLDAGFGLLMPDNSSIMGFNYDTEESAVEKLKTAPERLEVFIQQIRKKEKGIFNDYEGDTPEESTRELAKLIEPYSVTAPFYIEEDKCIGCGLCEKICTAKAIQYADKSQNVFRYTLGFFTKA